MMNLGKRFLLLALLLSLLTCSGLAQTNTGEIGGVIKDATGGVLPLATVAIKHTATGIATTRISDERGRFLFNGR
jgi:hypothetical protein